jgi:hypothetical protein
MAESRAAWIVNNRPVPSRNTCTGNVRRKIFSKKYFSHPPPHTRSFLPKNVAPSIAYLPSRFFRKKSLARKNKKNLFFLFYKNKIYFIFIIKIIYYFYLLLSKLKFSTQKHRFRVNGHKREILFFRNQEDYCVLPWNKRFHNLVLYICREKTFIIYLIMS